MSTNTYTIEKSELLHIMSAAIGAAYVSVEDAVERLRLKTVAPLPASGAKPAIQGELHPDDAAVEQFADALKDKLAKQRAKGYGGWQTCSIERLQEMLFKHIPKGDPVDVGNFAMFLWARGERTAYEDQWVYDLTGKWPGVAASPQASPDGGADLLFAFGGFLTSHKKRWVFSSADDSAPMVDAIREFAERHGIALDPDGGAEAQKAAPQAEARGEAVAQARAALVELSKAANARGFDSPIDNSLSQKYWYSLRDRGYAAIDALDATPLPAQVQPARDCGEYGHAEGVCGNASCCPSAQVQPSFASQIPPNVSDKPTCDQSVSDKVQPAEQVGKPDLDRVLSIADAHAEESREDGMRVLGRGGLLQFAKDVLRVFGSAQQQPVSAEARQALDAALALFPVHLEGQSFRIGSDGAKLRADDDDVFYSKRKVVNLLEALYGHLKAMRAALTLPQAEPGNGGAA